MKQKTRLMPPADRGPLRVMFVITSMQVGGAEMLLVNLIRRLDRTRFVPQLCCLKELGPLGEELSEEIPTFYGLLRHKYDVRVLARLTQLLRERRIDAVVTVGAGDKMFWGRLAAWRCGVPVILSALHSTGWPDCVGRLNRLLAPITDRFIAVAENHGEYLADVERFPAHKISVIPNGVDTQRFVPYANVSALRSRLGLPVGAPLIGIVAALRPEKDHRLMLDTLALVRTKLATAQLVIVGDGPLRPQLEAYADQLGLAEAVHFLGTRSDVPELVGAIDVLVLCSKMEANPVSILEAMAAAKPVVASAVGSIPQSVQHGQTGFLCAPGDVESFAHRLTDLLASPAWARRMGAEGRKFVLENYSLTRMVQGYETLLTDVYSSKCGAAGAWSRRGDSSSDAAARKDVSAAGTKRPE